MDTKNVIWRMVAQAFDMETVPAPMRHTVILPTLGGFIMSIIVGVLTIVLKDASILTLLAVSLFVFLRGPYLVYRWNSGKITAQAYVCTGTRRQANGNIVAKCSPLEDGNEDRMIFSSDLNILFSKKSARGIAPNANIIVYSDISSPRCAIAWEYAL